MDGAAKGKVRIGSPSMGLSLNVEYCTIMVQSKKRAIKKTGPNCFQNLEN